jgi:hypothetical protein
MYFTLCRCVNGRYKECIPSFKVLFRPLTRKYEENHENLSKDNRFLVGILKASLPNASHMHYRCVKGDTYGEKMIYGRIFRIVEQINRGLGVV